MRLDLRPPSQRPGEIVDPTTGELVALDDADALIEAFERIAARDRQLYAAKVRVMNALARLCPGDERTQYVRGRRRKCKVTLPSSGWSQPKLKEAWNSYPRHRDGLLRIASLAVNLREFKKAVKTAGTPDWEQFRDMVSGAELPPSGNPRIEPEPEERRDRP